MSDRALRRPAWPTFGLGLGIALTLAMNVAAGTAHSPLDAVVDGSVPIVFFVAVEVFIGYVKRGRNSLWGAVTMAGIAAVAAVISYSDGLFLVRIAGNRDWHAYLYPLLPDGLIVICLIALLAAGGKRTVSSPSFTDVQSAALEALQRTTVAGNPLSQNKLMAQFRLSRAEAREVCEAVPQERTRGGGVVRHPAAPGAQRSRGAVSAPPPPPAAAPAGVYSPPTAPAPAGASNGQAHG